MATKYLGSNFDIHGGGMDLLFPHHESEIAQSRICNHEAPVNYWMHNNMITINGRKMGKSYNNVIKLTELFSGNHPLLSQAFHPMTVRFFILQSHYRSTLDFSNEALLSSEKAFRRLWDAHMILQQLPIPENEVSGDPELAGKIEQWLLELPGFMDDDFGTPRVLANLFELAPIVNSIKEGIIGAGALSGRLIRGMQENFKTYLEDILGLQEVTVSDKKTFDDVMQLLIEIRKQARDNKDFMLSDKIRNQLSHLGIQLNDEKGGKMSWSLQKS